MDRRRFLATTLTAGTAASLTSTAGAAQEGKTIRIVGVSCSPRKGKTTATAIQVALDAAKAVDSRIKVALIDLGGLKIAGSLGGAT
jgi:1-aminocyclopropane-1-carboxylate deaminase/D-cysteine desulfhydrase-like pyridoxal-dependent ACC family enzyme